MALAELALLLNMQMALLGEFHHLALCFQPLVVLVALIADQLAQVLAVLVAAAPVMVSKEAMLVMVAAAGVGTINIKPNIRLGVEAVLTVAVVVLTERLSALDVVPLDKMGQIPDLCLLNSQELALLVLVEMWLIVAAAVGEA